MHLIAAATSMVPSWAFGLVVSMMSILIAIIGWFARREFQNKELEIQKLKNVLYGYTGEDGTRKAGIMERLEEHVKEYDRFKDESRNVRTKVREKEIIIENKISQVQQGVEGNAQGVTHLRERFQLAEAWIQEESERNRGAVHELKEKTDETASKLAQIDGKLDIMIRMISPDKKTNGA